MDGVIFAFTDGDAHTVEVFTKKEKALEEKSATESIEKAGKFKVTAFKATSLVKKKEV